MWSLFSSWREPEAAAAEEPSPCDIAPQEAKPTECHPPPPQSAAPSEEAEDEGFQVVRLDAPLCRDPDSADAPSPEGSPVVMVQSPHPLAVPTAADAPAASADGSADPHTEGVPWVEEVVPAQSIWVPLDFYFCRPEPTRCPPVFSHMSPLRLWDTNCLVLFSHSACSSDRNAFIGALLPSDRQWVLDAIALDSRPRTRSTFLTGCEVVGRNRGTRYHELGGLRALTVSLDDPVSPDWEWAVELVACKMSTEDDAPPRRARVIVLETHRANDIILVGPSAREAPGGDRVDGDQGDVCVIRTSDARRVLSLLPRREEWTFLVILSCPIANSAVLEVLEEFGELVLFPLTDDCSPGFSSWNLARDWRGNMSFEEFCCAAADHRVGSHDAIRVERGGQWGVAVFDEPAADVLRQSTGLSSPD